MLYLSGAMFWNTSAALFAAQYGLGLIVTPRYGFNKKTLDYFPWAVDTGCFTAGDKFDHYKYLIWLDKLPRTQLFATAPDIPFNHQATLERSRGPLRDIRNLGIKAAFCVQNGATVDNVPWDDFDALFIGGDTDWKLSKAAHDLVIEAKNRGKWSHMGRVNSKKRFEIARYFGCHSVDGTFLKHGPEKNLPRLKVWIEQGGLFDEHRIALQRRDGFNGAPL